MTFSPPFTKAIKKVGLIAKAQIAKSNGTDINKIVKFLRAHKKTVLFDESTAEKYKNQKGVSRDEILAQSDLVLVLGGDGTILKTAGFTGKNKALILGVNFGNLGFLSESSPADVIKNLGRIFKKQYKIDQRPLLRVTHYRGKQKENTFLAMNDAVINQGLFARLIELEIKLAGIKMVDFKADGLIVATPTGSTAHSLSAGGPIVHPDLNAAIITPICPSSLNLRPIAIPDSEELSIKVITRRKQQHYLGLTIDGQVTIPLEYGDIIKIRRSSRTFHLIRFQESNYYQTLREKLGWGAAR